MQKDISNYFHEANTVGKKLPEHLKGVIQPPAGVKMDVVIPPPVDTFTVPTKAKPLNLDGKYRGRKAKRNVGSSISKRRIDNVPEVYHRPLQGSAIYSGYFTDKGKPSKQPDLKDFEHRDMVGKVFENPNVNALRAFEPIPNLVETNLYLTSKVVTASNFAHRKNAGDTEYIIDQWKKSLEDCNVCWRCKNPIRVRAVGIKRPKQFKKRRKGLNLEDHYTTRNVIVPGNGVFAVVYTHCEILQAVDGKLSFRIVCESGKPANRRLIGVRYAKKVVENGKTRLLGRQFVEIKNGIETPIDIPSSYIVKNERCTCLFRQVAKVGKVK